MAKVAYDLLRALEKLANSWPDVIVPRLGRNFSAAAGRAVLMALYRRCNWSTFAIALPVGWGHRARPARDTDIASEVRLHPRTVGDVLRWLTDEQHILETIRGHGWTGATVRRFNLEQLGIVEAKPDAMSGFHSAEPEADMAEGEPDTMSLFSNRTIRESGDTETPGVLSHQRTDSEETVGARTADQVQREAIEQVSRRLPPDRKERVRVLRPSGDCQWSITENLVVLDFPRYDSSTRGYMYARSLLAELSAVLDQAFGMEVELRFKGHRQEQQR
jgi:hypothetical protein